jgi:hypothetical protein
MGRVASVFSRRIPLYIWLPIILACAAAGVVASRLRPIHPPPGKPNNSHSAVSSQASVTASPAMEPTRADGSRLSNTPSSPRDAVPIAVPTGEIDLPTPAYSVAKRQEKVAGDAGVATPPVPAAQGVPPRARPASADRSGPRTSRTQRTAQQPAKSSPTAAAGLKNVPIIGPVFSLFQ